MTSSDTEPSGPPEHQSNPEVPVPEQEDFPRPAGNRLFFWLLVAAAFFIVDMAILFYVFRPTADKVTVDPEQPVVAVPQNGRAISAAPDAKE